MDTDQVLDGPQRSPGLGFPRDDKKRPYAKGSVTDELSGRFSQLWTKRQNPEWKPRRASVATCQQQQRQQQQLMAQHHGYKTTYQFNLTSANIKELIVQRRLQQHYQRNDITIDRCAHDEVATRRKHEDQDITSGRNCENLPQGACQADVVDQQTAIVSGHSGADMARARSISPASISTDVTTTTSTTTTNIESEGKLTSEGGSDGGAECKPDRASSTSGGSIWADEVGRAVSESSGPASNQKLSNLAATCCADPVRTETVTSQRDRVVAFDGHTNELTPESVNAELQIQDKQRKHVILTMAMKQLMAERDSKHGAGDKSPADLDCCQCASFRSRSCSVSSTRTTPTRATLTASVLNHSRSVVFNDEARHTVTAKTVELAATTGPDKGPATDTDAPQLTKADESPPSSVDGSSQDPAGDEDSFCDIHILPQQKRRFSGTSDYRAQDERNILRPQSSTQQQQQQRQARNSIGENILTRLNSMRQLVTSKNASDRENQSDSEHAWRSQLQFIDNCNHAIGQSYEIDSPRSGSNLDQQWQRTTSHARASCDMSRRSCSALGKGIASAGCAPNRAYQSNQNDINLEALIVESWLDDHPNFTRDYIMRKATRQVVDDWLVANAKVSNTNLSSQADLRSIHTISRPVSQISLGGFLREPSWRGSEQMPNDLDEYDSQSTTFGSLRANRSNSQSASATNRAHGFSTPIRKISATDFETRTGSGFLRPMLSKTPDGRLTFLPQLSLSVREQANSVRDTIRRVSEKPDSHQSSALDDSEISRSKRSSATSEVARTSHLTTDDTVHEGNNNNRLADDSLRANAAESDDDGEVKLIFELVKNIYDDLDIRTLLHKILKNIAVLINADRSSLFLVCGGPGDPNRRLVSQLFNVDQDSIEVGEPDESITIPWGTGLVGFVAASGEAVNITDCYEDPRFTDAIDQRTGYVTRHMLCAPILDKRNEIVGVAQVINKRDGNAFSKSDELKFMRYLQFCGIGLRNAQSYEQCQLENRRNQVLLDLARMVFEEQSTIEQVVYRIMLHTQSLLDCERCQVLLIDDGNDELENLHQFSASQRPTPLQCNDVFAQRRLDKCSQYRALLMDQEHNKAGEVLSSDVGETDSPNPAEHRRTQSIPKLFSLVFDLECDGNDPVIHNSKEPSESAGVQATKTSRAFPVNIGITGYVALTGETLNIEDAHKNERFDVSVDEGSDFKHKSILCMPIRNGQRQIIGVIQLINKKNGQPFNKNDEDLFEAFAIFCGLGIHNTLMYERVLKVMAKQRVTFEVLSYHATAPLEEAKKLSLEQIPSCFALNLASLKFNDFSLDEQYMLKSCLRFFLDLDLMRRFQIDQLVLCNWILSVQKNYRKVTYHPIVGGNGLKASPVRYHNWRHAFNVSQMMFAILVNTQICQALGELETLALLIACLCHDLDHRGTNNSFQIKSASPLAELYSTSTMEHHHFDQCVMILNSQGNQILANLSPEEYSRVIMLLEEAILATDLANYFRNRDIFFQLINSNNFDWHNDQAHRSLLRCMLMTACDVAAITKPWPVQKVVADLVMSEFYQQGDIERNELNIEPIDMMNRDKMSELPSMQIGFIDSICAPIYTAFAKLFPHELTTLLDGCLTNRNLWREVAESNVPPDTPLINYLTCDNDELCEKPPSPLSEYHASKSDTNLKCENQRVEGSTLKRKNSSPSDHDKGLTDDADHGDPVEACDESFYVDRPTSQRKSI